MKLVEMIFKEDFLVAQAGNFESHCCLLTRIEWILARLIWTLWYSQYDIPYGIPYDMGHMTWHELLVPQHNKLGHIWHGSSCQKCKNTSWKPSVKPKYFVHEIKNQAEHLIFVPFGSPSRWFWGLLLSVYSSHQNEESARYLRPRNFTRWFSAIENHVHGAIKSVQYSALR